MKFYTILGFMAVDSIVTLIFGQNVGLLIFTSVAVGIIIVRLAMLISTRKEDE